MIKFSLSIAIWFIINSVFGQINFIDKANIYDYDSLSTNIIYDDFDNDGDLDIIKYNYKNVLIQKNVNGDFNSNSSIIIANDVNPIISLDLNNDNYPDLITYHSFNTIGILYNLQNDTFSEEETILNFSGSYSINPIKFDYNQDGFIDIIVTNDATDVYVLLNNQVGGFDSPQFIIPLGGVFNSVYKIDDFDNDGDFDFYIKESNYIKIYLNDNGSFDQPNILQTHSPLYSYGILDIDGNGFKDIIYWKNGAIWAKYFGYNENEFIVLNDLSVVDNIPFYTFSNNNNSIYIENGVSTEIYNIYIALETIENHNNIYKFRIQNNIFSEPQLVLSNFEVNIFYLNQYNFLDLNNDGKLDFSFTSNLNNQEMILINYDINFISDKTICIQQTIWPNTFSVIDMNGDGIEDICIGTQNGLGYFEKNTNTELGDMRNLIGVVSNPNASTYTMNNIIDFDNNDLGDVIDFGSSEAKVYRNLGDDNFEHVQNIPITHYSTTGIYFVDIDSDGFLDIVFENFESLNNYSEFNWAKNNNGINFGNPQPLVINNSTPISAVSIAFNDFNNDNQTDMLILNYYLENDQWNSEVVLLENENGQFSGNSIAIFEGDYAYGHVKVIDLDQDGDLDFFVYSINNDQPFLYYSNDGQNSFDKTIIGNINIEDIEFDDNDGDGVYEVYAWNYNETELYNIFYYATTDYINFSKIEIDSYTTYYNEINPNTRGDLLLYDYDNDNKKDLFISNYSFGGLISVYKNSSETLEIVDVENSNLTQFKLYPNPFVTSVYWNGNKNKDYTLQLFTLSGKSIYKNTTSNNSLDLSFLERGVYLFVIEDKNLNIKWEYKIIKKH